MIYGGKNTGVTNRTNNNALYGNYKGGTLKWKKTKK